MGGGDHDASGAAEFPHGEAQFRDGAKGIEKIGTDPQIVQDRRAKQSEFAGVTPVVMADGDAFLAGVLEALLQEKAEPVGGFPYGEAVEAVQPDAEFPPHAPGSEGSLLEERVFLLLLAHGQKGLFLVFLKRRAIEPFAVSFFDVHIFPRR